MHIPACETTELELIRFDRALEEGKGGVSFTGEKSAKRKMGKSRKKCLTIRDGRGNISKLSDRGQYTSELWF